jgi:hypothetical protein
MKLKRKVFPMRKMQWIGAAFILCSTLFAAELRTWTDENGKKFEGRFDKELFGDVLIRDENRRNHFIPIKKLSPEDREYIYNNVPPEVEIKFTRNVRQRPEQEWTILGDKTFLYTCTVDVEKTSALPYKRYLMAELFLLAEERDGPNLIIMERTESKFRFPEEEERPVHTFKVVDVPFRQFRNLWAQEVSTDRGEDYLGYLVAVSDEDENLITYKTDLSVDWLVEDIPQTVTELRNLAIQGRGSVRSRHFDDFFSKVDPPRVPWHKRTIPVGGR